MTQDPGSSRWVSDTNSKQIWACNSALFHCVSRRSVTTTSARELRVSRHFTWLIRLPFPCKTVGTEGFLHTSKWGWSHAKMSPEVTWLLECGSLCHWQAFFMLVLHCHIFENMSSKELIHFLNNFLVYYETIIVVDKRDSMSSFPWTRNLPINDYTGSGYKGGETQEKKEFAEEFTLKDRFCIVSISTRELTTKRRQESQGKGEETVLSDSEVKTFINLKGKGKQHSKIHQISLCLFL